MVAPRTRAEASGQPARMEAINTDRPGTRFRPQGPGETSKARLALSLRGYGDRGSEYCLQGTRRQRNEAPHPTS